ncbi:MAG: hypothetical protein WDO73_12700 [Ignavibacteriota bacterium]
MARSRACVEASERSSLSLAVLALAESAIGSKGAEDLLRNWKARARTYYVPGTALALVNLACGRRGEALRQLQRARRERDWWSMYAGAMPVWNELRGAPQFRRLTAPRPGARNAGARAHQVVVLATSRAACGRHRRHRSGRLVSPPGEHGASLSGCAHFAAYTTGNAERAAIAPDGSIAAYVLRQEGWATVWIRKIEGRVRPRVSPGRSMR